MDTIRTVVVLDAADVAAVSTFWAGMFDGLVVDDDPTFHCVIDADGRWRLGVQLAPDHEAPQWPYGSPQQIHLDLHVTDPMKAEAHALSLGAEVLQRSHDPGEPEGHIVFADPAGHPFCIGWGHPDDRTLERFLAERNAH